MNPYEQHLDRNAANHAPLTPLSFIARTAYIWPHRVSVIHGERRYTWNETYARSRRLASALAQARLRQGRHHRRDARQHAGDDRGKFRRADDGRRAQHAQHAPRRGGDRVHARARRGQGPADRHRVRADGGQGAFAAAGRKPLVIDIADFEGPGGELLGQTDYEALLAEGDPEFEWAPPGDEWDAISLNYTSGTTGNPKGVVYHHRGAYLNALSNIIDWGMPRHAVYLWTLPLFHCNGWCFAWTMAANAGTNVCLRRVEAKAIFDAIREHSVTHYCGAPIVHSLLINAPEEMKRGIAHKVHGLVAAAAPPAAMIEGAERMGFDITHVYGLTEVYGPASVCAKHPEWDDLDIGARTERNGRQGVRYTCQEGMTVLDPETMQPVPWDGETMGEIMFRGNIMMKGYLKNPKTTDEAFAGGWYHTGDLAVMQPDGYVKIKDRSKDIIISGGENISSIEVEDVLYRHPSVLTAAVVAQPDPKWGETPCAFVELKAGATTTEAELIAHCKQHLARFKAPNRIVFGEVPKTSTGKIQKFLLRERVRSTSAIQ